MNAQSATPQIAARPAPRPWRRMAAAAGALLCLNGLLGFRSGWIPGSVLPDSRLAPEFVALWLLLLGLALRGTVSHGVVSVVTAITLVLVLGRYVDVIVPGVFGRPINLY